VGDENRNAGGKMETVLSLIAFLVIWIVLQTWVLPRLGVPT
jgi:uncharacterized membrane protein